LHDGRELVGTLEHIWAANGCLTAAHGREVTPGPVSAYEEERMFAAAET